MPCLHSPPVGTSVPSMSIRASSEELAGLSSPGLLPHFVEDVEQRADMVLLEAAAEVAGGGRVGNAPRAQGVEIDFVGAPQFQVFQAIAVAQGVVGQVQHVIAFVIRQMNLQQVQPAVDGLGQAEFLHQQPHRADDRRRPDLACAGPIHNGCCPAAASAARILRSSTSRFVDPDDSCGRPVVGVS